MILFAFKKVFENTTDALLGAVYTNKFDWNGIQQAMSDRVRLLTKDKIREDSNFMFEGFDDPQDIANEILSSDEYANFITELKAKFDQIPEDEISNYVSEKYKYKQKARFDGQSFNFNLDVEVDEEEYDFLSFDQFWQMIQDRNNA